MAAPNNLTPVPGDATGLDGPRTRDTRTRKQNTHNHHITSIPSLAMWHGVSYWPFLLLAVISKRELCFLSFNIGEKKLYKAVHKTGSRVAEVGLKPKILLPLSPHELKLQVCGPHRGLDAYYFVNVLFIFKVLPWFKHPFPGKIWREQIRNTTGTSWFWAWHVPLSLVAEGSLIPLSAPCFHHQSCRWLLTKDLFWKQDNV